MSKQITRRTFVKGASATIAMTYLPSWAFAADEAAHTFDPRPGTWRTFEVTTTIKPKDLTGTTTVWVPAPSVNSDWQRSLETTFSGNASARLVTINDSAQCVVGQFTPDLAEPTFQIVSRVQTQNRAIDWSKKSKDSENHKSLQKWIQPTALQPTDGIVRKTALQITDGAKGDMAKAQRIYDWIIVNTYREPKVKGCGLGDIKAMLETGNLGGKCADINGLFVGLCRAVGLPARDAYGLRLAPSAFGYRELGGNNLASLQGAQHCRAEVYIRDHGWVAMDPADVDKVMRQETADWIKDADHPLVAPVRKSLFGGWEGNWMAYNQTADLILPGSNGASVPFLMYPQAENEKGRYDPLDAAAFNYAISAREIAA